jgi:hypothetical protein
VPPVQHPTSRDVSRTEFRRRTGCPCSKGRRASRRSTSTLPDDLRETLAEQRKLRGAPLYPYLFYARNPAYFRAAKAMWAALQEEAKRVPVTLRALLNRRVAS